MDCKCEHGEKGKTDTTKSHDCNPWLSFPGGVTAADERQMCKRRAKTHQSGDFWTARDHQSDFYS
jgi:hypothetical protein